MPAGVRKDIVHSSSVNGQMFRCWSIGEARIVPMDAKPTVVTTINSIHLIERLDIFDIVREERGDRQ
jgi:hypothetical protein